jgi:DNA polymerase III subunit delta
MIYLIYGPDIFRAKQFLDQLKSDLVASGATSQTVDGSSLSVEKLDTILQPQQLFSQKQLVIIKNPLSNKQKTVSAHLVTALESVDQDLALAIWEQNNLDKRSALYKKCRQLAEIHEFSLLKPGELLAWLKKYCLQHNINIHHQALVKLLQKNTDTFALINELNKLKTYSDNNITPEMVEQLTPGQSTEIIFDLTDQLGHKNGRAYLTALELLKKGEDQFKILGALATHIHNLLLLKEALDNRCSISQVQTISGLHPFVIKKSVSQLKNFSQAELKQLYHTIAAADWHLKSGQGDFAGEMFKITHQY